MMLFEKATTPRPRWRAWTRSEQIGFWSLLLGFVDLTELAASFLDVANALSKK
jgi:hypothetical protein